MQAVQKKICQIPWNIDNNGNNFSSQAEQTQPGKGKVSNGVKFDA